MFTGLVETLAKVAELRPESPGVRIVLESIPFVAEVKLGDSIAINGCCLTVVGVENGRLEFQAGEETLSRTNLGRMQSGASVNVERSLKLGDRLDGHLVTGHIDGQGVLDSRRDNGDWSDFWFRCPEHLAKQMASKGSVAVDGVSLTLVEVTRDRFSVALIPHTLSHTTLGGLRPGDPVNLETDVLAKYVDRQLQFAKDAS